MEEQAQNALDLFKKGEYEKAAKLYLKLAAENFPNEDYLILAANCYDQLGEKKVAVGIYKKVLAENPACLTALLNLSTLYYELKKFEKSLQIAQKALLAEPENFSALLNLGNSNYALGRYEEAMGFYEQIYERNPNSYNALLNIANTAYNLGDNIKAISFARDAMEKRPSSVEPYIIAGNAFIELSQNNEATAYLKKAAELAPASDWLCNSLANLFQKMGNAKLCLHYAWKAIALKGGALRPDDHINFAYFLYEAKEEGAEDVMLKYLERWEEMFGENPIVHHACCALKNVQEVKEMDLSYVEGLFDGFASSFDNILKDLEYQAPELIAQALGGVLKAKLFKKRRILDLGCGTGLVVEALRKYLPNEEFFGVDISEKMLEVAGKKEIYKALYADDLLSFLAANEEEYHAVVAGDVFTYIGDLKPLFRLIAGAVKFNGFLCFSISKNLENGNDYFLTPSGRFVHSLAYVNRLLKYCGFKVISSSEAVLRHEGAKDVAGGIVLAQKEIQVLFE